MTTTGNSSVVRRHVLESPQARVAVLSRGAAVQSWEVKTAQAVVPVVLGFAEPAAYLDNRNYLGAVVGRVANRVANARFTLGGREYRLVANDGPHQLHGGPRGWSTRDWEMEPDGTRAVRLRLVSEDGDQGWPGRVEAEVTLTLDGATLTWEMRAMPDKVTPVNMAQHCYFNLAGAGDIRDHLLQVRASRYTPTGPDLIPDGSIAPVEGTIYDFRSPRRIAEADPHGIGHDANFALDPGSGPAAVLTAPNGLKLTLETDQPGLQFYTGFKLAPGAAPGPGPEHRPWAGLCLEAQGFPDAVNRPGFPSILVGPDRPGRQTTRITIA